MSAEIASTSSAIRPVLSPLQQIGNRQTHDTLNNNRGSFNRTLIRAKYNINVNIQSPPSSRLRRVSVTPSLASIASDDSSGDPVQTRKRFHTPSQDETTQVEGNELGDNDDHEHAPRLSIALNSEASFSQASSSQDVITPVEGRYGHQGTGHATPVASKSRARFPSLSASVSHLGSVKKKIMSMSAHLRRGSKVLLPKFQPTSSETNPWTEFNIKNVDDYVPDGMARKYRNYMRSPHLSQTNAIPVWNPSPIRGVNVRRRIRIDVGDVGTFTRRGGFRVAFNILLNKETNKSCGYNLPQKFYQFAPPLTSEQEGSCNVKDDGLVIDLDNCGAIDSEGINCADALYNGFKPGPCKSSWKSATTRCDISPEAGKDERRGYIYLPHGAKVYSFSSNATNVLDTYLKSCVQDWIEYLNKLWQREKAPPMVVTSVWAARSFACATYTVHPPNTSAVAQVRTEGDKIYWAQASEGFETGRAPLEDGYDDNDKLKSQVEDQCFAIEGYVLRSRKEVAKLHASLVTI